MSALNNSALIGASGSTGYQISRSVRLRSSASAYFNRTPASAGNRKTWTWSGWVKRGDISTAENPLFTGYTDANNRWYARFEQNTLRFYWNIAATSNEVYTNAVFRDPSAWYHVVVAVDTTQATDSNRIKVYVNGVQQTLSGTYIPQNADTQWNNNVVQTIGKKDTAGTYFDGYMTEVNSIDGQALTPASFGETNSVTGVWQPKKYAGTYGTNGFYLNFSDNSGVTATTIGKDYSGNGNNWTPNNISLTAGVTYDSMLDVPTQWADGGNGRGNYCTLNPLAAGTSSYLSGGNLNASISPSNTSVFGTFQIPSSGKWYWEYQITTIAGGGSPMGGISTTTASSPAAFYRSDGTKLIDGTGSAYGASYTTTDTVGVAVDVDGGTITFYKNNSSQGAITYASAGYYPTLRSNVGGDVFNINFGQRPFAYTPPSGFKALNTLNLPTPTILKGNRYFDATLWDGNSTNARVITTNVSTVDFAWVKKRNGADDHRLANTVTGGNRHLKSNTTEAESTATTVIQAFSGSTFTLGTDNSVNATGGTYVGWTWAEGATQGFDIVTYTGNGANRTVAHNLGVAPSMMIVKRRDSGPSSWTVWHSSFSSIEYIYLNLTNAKSSSSGATVWNSTLPTSSVFSLGTYTDVNANAGTFVAYLFSQIAGFSAFGSYTGNGSADGTFVFTGFRPAFILVKASSNSTASTVWTIWDTRRSPSNAAVLELFPNSSSAEFTDTNGIDILSNGFKPRRNSEYANFSGWTYIYAAFAENPFKNALAR